jgi:hypothetical protein
LPPHRSYDHKIELVPGSKLPFSRPSPYAKRWWTTDLTQLRRIYTY